MFKRIAGSALAAALTLSVSAKDKDHVIDFNEVRAESSGRNLRHLVSTAKEPKETFNYLYLSIPKSNKALYYYDEILLSIIYYSLFFCFMLRKRN